MNKGFASTTVWLRRLSTRGRPLRLEVLEARLALASLPAPSGLVAWWSGDGTAADDVGTNNGILEGGSTFAPGLIGQAFSLDGIDDRIRVPNSSALNPATGFTIEAWIRPDPNDWNEGYRVIVSKWNDDKRDWSYILKQVNFRPFNSPAFEYRRLMAEISTGENSGSFQYYLSQSRYRDGWQHVAITFDTTTARFYLNGVLDGSSATDPTLLLDASNTDLLIGAAYTGGGIKENFGGLLDEVKLYSRSLSAEEIWAEFDAVASKAVVVDDAYVAANGNSLVVRPDGVLANDHGALGAKLVSPPLHGTLELDGSGAFTYVPNNGYFGNDRFTYRANGSSGGIATVWIKVTRPEPSELPPEAVAWWSGDGDAKDSVGANDGTLQGTKFALGKVGQAFDFHGSGGNIGESVEVVDSPNLNLGAGDFTINLWMNLRSFNEYDGRDTPYSINPLVGQAESAYSFYGVPWYTLPYSGWGLFLKGNKSEDGVIYGAINLHYYAPGNRPDSGWGGVDVSYGFLPVLDKWYNLAVTWSDSRFTFYVDGVACQPTVYPFDWLDAEAPPLPDVAAPLTIGSTIGGPRPDSLNGLIDELIIYDRALSQTEIQSIYNAASAGLVIRAIAEDGAQSIAGVAQQIFNDVPTGGGPSLAFATTAENATLFSEQPVIDSTGTLAFKPALNSQGKTVVTVAKKSVALGTALEGEGEEFETAEFVIEIVQQAPWQNDVDPNDVNNDGNVAPEDVLLVIDQINGVGGGEILNTNSQGPFYDANGDNYVTASDVLDIINWLNADDTDAEGEFGGVEAEAQGLVGRASSSTDVVAESRCGTAVELDWLNCLASDVAGQPKRGRVC